MNELQKVELLEVESTEEFERYSFQITDMNSLNWVFRKLAALSAKEKDVKQLADTERERINDWENRELISICSDKNYFESLVSAYHAKQLEENPKAKTLSTPFGKSKSRASKPQPNPVDKDKLLQHVKATGMTEFIKEEVKWGDLKKVLHIHEADGQPVVIDESGTIVEGVEVEPSSLSFKVEV
ncbi:host-nuclease inhibitor Gam family protein [Priestia filamentosa]|uniref:host-nuclease inhibitor Gam family protein n=1 Tax=Priestia filamentosa TaxID=1402861 RepID=UPI003981C790